MFVTKSAATLLFYHVINTFENGLKNSILLF